MYWETQGLSWGVKKQKAVPNINSGIKKADKEAAKYLSKWSHVAASFLGGCAVPSCWL